MPAPAARSEAARKGWRSRKRMALSQAEATEAHALRRLAERYGISDPAKGRALMTAIARKLRSALTYSRGRHTRRERLDAKLLGRPFNGRSTWMVEVDGRWFQCAYDQRLKMVVTFLPQNGGSFL